MLVGGVVGHEVEQNLEPPPMGLHQQIVEIGQRAEARIDVAIVGDVIAEINHRRRVDGRDPDRVDAKADKIVEPPLDPLEVADAVAVGVLKGARVDLVDHARLPPENSERGRQLRRPYCGACSPGDESHSFTWQAVTAWRAFLILASRNEPGGSSFASSLRRMASSTQTVM